MLSHYFLYLQVTILRIIINSMELRRRSLVKKLFIKLFKNHWLELVLIILLLINIGQFIYFSYQNQQLQSRISLIDYNYKKDLSDTKRVVTNLSQYFEGKGNITIEALLATYKQLQQDESQLKNAVDTLNNNAAVTNENARIANQTTAHLQQQICVLSYGYLCK